jgi:transcriptional regulator with XRE-family HTH domain
MTFGKRLQALRAEAGLSQTQLAARAGLSIDSFRNWEQDRVLPRIDTATRLARALGVSLDVFAVDDDGGAEEPEPGPKPKGRGRRRGQKSWGVAKGTIIDIVTIATSGDVAPHQTR